MVKHKFGALEKKIQKPFRPTVISSACCILFFILCHFCGKILPIYVLTEEHKA